MRYGSACGDPSIWYFRGGGKGWAKPGVYAEASSATPAVTGCNRLSFDPSLSVVPGVRNADSPSGYTVDLQVPQSEEPEGLASSDLEDASVMLPESASVSLSGAEGLKGCGEAQFALGSSMAPLCSDSSKIGDVAVETPLLAHPLQGAIYLAAPGANPFDSQLAIYLAAKEAGVSIKLAGQLEPDPATGRMTIVLDELPQLPISNLELRFFGGPRALLSTPAECGQALSAGALTPWSGSGGVSVSSAFDVDLGVEGTSCSEPQPFSPTFETESTEAGEPDAYGSFTLSVSRAAWEAELGAIKVQAPSAVAQMFAGASPCAEPQASEGACPAASHLGAVGAEVGLGPDPSYLTGRLYLTGPFRGSPQGLLIALPVTPGPFELGTLLVRASAQIEAGANRLRIATEPLPNRIDGIPLQIRALALQFERGEFRIDPEGCESLAVTGTITSAQGSSVSVSTDPLGASSSPCPSPQTPSPDSPPSPPSSAPPNAASVSLDATHIFTNGHGVSSVKLTCKGSGTCAGRLALMSRNAGKERRRSKKMTIGRGRFSIPAGVTVTVKLRLDAQGRALLRMGHGRLGATLTILKSSPTPARTDRLGVRLVSGRRAPRRKGKTRFTTPAAQAG
jgi:hypothetical protein